MTFAVSMLFASSARADDWATPTQRTIQSPDHKLQAVISPAADRASTATAAIGPKDHLGKPFALTTPEMPVDSVLFDDGSLLTFDRWGQLGFGNVATLYERGGKLRWTKTLEELLGAKLADAAPRSVSSILWRKTPVELTIAADHKSAVITLFDESQLKLMLGDGRATIVAVAKLPDDPQRLLNRARALAGEDGQEAAAIALLDRAIALDANQLEAVQLEVELLQRSKDHARVAALLDRVSPHWTSPQASSSRTCASPGRSA